MLLSALTLAAERWWLALLAISTSDLANISSALNSLSWRSGWRPPTWFHRFLGFFLIEFLSHTFSYQKILSAHFQLHTVTPDAKLLYSSSFASILFLYRALVQLLPLSDTLLLLCCRFVFTAALLTSDQATWLLKNLTFTLLHVEKLKMIKVYISHSHDNIGFQPLPFHTLKTNCVCVDVFVMLKCRECVWDRSDKRVF